MAAKAVKKDKPGKVVRLDPLIWKSVNQSRKGKETISATLRRLLGLPPRKGNYVPNTYYVLPGSLCGTVEEARGEAIVRSVRGGKRKSIENPISVRLIE